MSELFNLNGMTLVVSGGAGLIGKAFSEVLAEYGATTVVADIDKETGQQLSDDHEKIEYHKCNVMVEQEVRDLIDRVSATHGGIDGLINTSFPRPESWSKRYEDLTFGEWQTQINYNLNTYFLNAKAATDAMLKQDRSGVIVNLASIYGIQAPYFDIYNGTDMTSPVAYAAIKGGIINLTRYMASYLGEYGIRVNAISPGGVWDEQHPTFVRNYEQRVPLERMASPKDLEGAIVYLVSDAASYVTGHNLVVDGGWTIC
jgi:NAD(P)-dependent dehydrogenase (short-subunit alcohol dehydrogenase family)